MEKEHSTPFLLGQLSADVKTIKEQVDIIFKKLDAQSQTEGDHKTQIALIKKDVGQFSGIVALVSSAVVTFILNLFFKFILKA